ncbi:SNF2 family N-terminal domain-containing protein, partial [Coniochaeta sp. 2T2.1]
MPVYGRSVANDGIVDSDMEDFLNDIDNDSDDELPTGKKSSYFTQPTQIIPRSSPAYQTQPTQIIPKSSPSSPRSVVEVPASPGVQRNTTSAPARKLPLAIAPAGTAFRNPVRPAAPVALPQAKKRAFIDISDEDLPQPVFIDDSSDDDTPARGSIKPSSFISKKPVSQEQPEPAKTSQKAPKLSQHRQLDLRIQQLAKKLHKELQGRINVSVEDCRKAIAKAPSRRLVQGRLSRNASPPSSPFSPDPIAEAPAVKIINLVSSGEDDDFDEDEASSPSQSQSPAPKGKSEAKIAHEERVLKYLNGCNRVQLMTIAKIPAAKADAMLKHKPFDTISDGRKVTMMHKTKKKASKVSIGDEVMDAVEEFITHLDRIDHLVDVCDERGKALRAATTRWNLDIYGQNRSGGNTVSEEPMTPSSRGTSANPDGLSPPPIAQEPELMRGHCQLKSYQLYGLNWLNLLYQKNIGAILADDMGLGKTCQVISLLCSVIEEYRNSPNKAQLKRPWPNVVVVPPSTFGNWAAEFEKFAPELKVTLYKGSQLERDELFEEMQEDSSDIEVILTTYTQVGRPEDARNLGCLKPVMVVFDEGHMLKNPETKLYKRLQRIGGSWKLMLTGTPIQNNLMEMIGLLQMLEPSLFQHHFGDLENLFNQKVSLKDVSEGALDFDDRVNRARSILDPFILQRKKEQVLELPKKTHTVVYCELHDKQREIYERFEDQFRKDDSIAKEKKVDLINIENNPWIQTRKAALHPLLFRREYTKKKVEELARTLWKNWPSTEERPDTLARFTSELMQYSDFDLHLWCRDHVVLRPLDLPKDSLMWSGKIQKLLELVHRYKENGDRALIFTRFKLTVPILQEVLDAEGIKNRQFQGSTEVGERQELIEEFNEDDSITAFIITTGSGATGINLTSANKVIIFDPSDNPQTDIQAENRAHRIGQTRPVEVIRLVTKGTVEELILAAGQKKIELARKVTG